MLITGIVVELKTKENTNEYEFLHGSRRFKSALVYYHTCRIWLSHKNDKIKQPRVIIFKNNSYNKFLASGIRDETRCAVKAERVLFWLVEQYGVCVIVGEEGDGNFKQHTWTLFRGCDARSTIQFSW